jgi:hypothetical protein
MKNHITQQDLKPDSPLPLAIAVQEGVIVGSDADGARTSTAKATGDNANDPIESQPGSQGTGELGKLEQ